MRIYEEINKNILGMKKFTDVNAQDWALLNVETGVSGLIAEFVPHEMMEDSSWQESDVEAIHVDYDKQVASGGINPYLSDEIVNPDDMAFDREEAISIALDLAIEFLLSGKEASHAA